MDAIFDSAWVSVFVSFCCCDKHNEQKQLVKEDLFHLTIQSYNLSLRDNMAGLQAIPEADTVELFTY